MDLQACLPPYLQGSATVITPIAAGLSGAGVYHVEREGRAYVLKVDGAEERAGAWQHNLAVQRLAADAALAPRVVYVDEDRHVVVTDFVVDRSIFAVYGNPDTHDAAVVMLADTVRRLHALPAPPAIEKKDPRGVLAGLWDALAPSVAVPSFVVDAMQQALREPELGGDRPAVLSHNDLNPTNLIYDGKQLLLLDWNTAGLNDPYYDLATASVFLRMDEATCRKLLAAYEQAPVTDVSEQWAQQRRLAALLPAATMFQMARQKGYAGADRHATLDGTLGLAELYQRLMAGSVQLASPEGQWQFALALSKECATELACRPSYA